MNNITTYILNHTREDIYKSLESERIKNKYPRYDMESFLIQRLALQQLNLEKNRNKPKFEDNDIFSNFTLYMAENFELKHEFNQEIYNYEKILNEIGDCGAMLTGILAWVIEHKDKYRCKDKQE